MNVEPKADMIVEGPLRGHSGILDLALGYRVGFDTGHQMFDCIQWCHRLGWYLRSINNGEELPMGYARLLAAAAATTVGFSTIVPSARAEILASASRPGNYTNTLTTPVSVPLDSAGSVSLPFRTTVVNETVRIIYNAECGALGSVGSSWLSVSVLVDGVAAQPNSGTSFALCTSASTSSYIWTGAVRQSQIRVAKPGVHKVVVNATGVSTTSWWLGDTSIVVDR